MYKKLLVFAFFLIVVCAQKPLKDKTKNTNSQDEKPARQKFEDIDYLSYLQKIGKFRQKILDNPEEFGKITQQFNIKSDEQIIARVIQSHITEYRDSESKEGKENAKKNLDLVIKYLFDGYNVKNYQQLFEQDYLNERVTKKYQDLDQLAQSDDLDIQNISQAITGLLKNKIKEDKGKKYDQSELADELEDAIERIFDYYQDERGYKKEDLKFLRESRENMGSVSFYIEQYLYNEDFQDLIEDLLEGDLDMDDLLDVMEDNMDTFDINSSDWGKASKKIDSLANDLNIDLDTENIQDMIEEFRDQQEQKQRQKEIQEQENQNRKHDPVITIFLGTIFFAVLAFFGFRYWKQKKLQKDLNSRYGQQKDESQAY